MTAEAFVDTVTHDAGSSRSGADSLFRRFLHNKVAVGALLVLIIVFICSVLASVIAPFDPNKQNLLRSLEGPSGDHWAGTDDKGRDVLSRLLYAGRIAFKVSGLSVALAVAIGVPVGLFIGYRGGWWDRVVMRLVEAVITIPPLVSILALIGVLGTGVRNTAIALGLVFSTGFLRLTRGEVLAVREETFVSAAQVTGISHRRIMWRHILPVAAPPLIVHVTLMFGAALLAEAGLSFLGVGVQVPDASWGSMLAGAQAVVLISPGQAVPAGLAILLTVLCVNLVGDGLRDSLAREGPTSTFGRKRRLRPSATFRKQSEPGALLEVDGVGIAFPSRTGSKQAVSDVSFVVRAGETVALVGESGCGKSITALTIPGLLPPPGVVTAGSIRLNGRDLLTLDAKELGAIRGSEIGMVFQEPSACLNPAFTVGTQIAAPLRAHDGLSRRAARRRAIEMLGRVGIPDPETRVDQYPHEFSGGMAQRVMIAVALACEPSLLIADEPTTALDVTIQNQVLDLIHGLRDELGMGVVFVTHDLAVVADLADRAVVLYAGEVVEEGTVESVFADPRHPYTRALMRSVPRHERRTEDLVGIPGSVPEPGSWPSGCRFAPRCELADDACRRAPVDLVTDGNHSHRCIKVDLSKRLPADQPLIGERR